jgi:formylglycine-generating enzyme required for sulfatase activity
MKKNLIFTFLLTIVMGSSLIYAQQSGVKMPVMIHVEGGTFMMGNANGSEDEKPLHSVTVDNFYIGKYEVTFQDFKKFIDATGYLTDAEQPDSINFKHGLPPRGANN